MRALRLLAIAALTSLVTLGIRPLHPRSDRAIMNRLRSVFVFVCLALLITHQAQATSSTYSFNGLSGGSLVGQDNWVLMLGDSMQVVAGSGANPSLVAANPGTDYWNSNWVFRPDDISFSIPDLTGTESFWYLEADLVAVPNDPVGGFWFYIGDSISTSNISPWMGMGVDASDGSNKFLFRGAGYGTTTFVPTPASITQGDWIRIRLVMDFTSQVGDVYYMNLTQGDTGFTAISGLQDLDLLAGAQAAIDPSAWDAMFLRSDHNNSSSAIDNLTVNVVPEPTTLILLATGLAALGLKRSCKN